VSTELNSSIVLSGGKSRRLGWLEYHAPPRRWTFLGEADKPQPGWERFLLLERRATRSRRV